MVSLEVRDQTANCRGKKVCSLLLSNKDHMIETHFKAMVTVKTKTAIVAARVKVMQRNYAGFKLLDNHNGKGTIRNGYLDDMACSLTAIIYFVLRRG